MSCQPLKFLLVGLRFLIPSLSFWDLKLEAHSCLIPGPRSFSILTFLVTIGHSHHGYHDLSIIVRTVTNKYLFPALICTVIQREIRIHSECFTSKRYSNKYILIASPQNRALCSEPRQCIMLATVWSSAGRPPLRVISIMCDRKSSEGPCQVPSNGKGVHKGIVPHPRSPGYQVWHRGRPRSPPKSR